MSIEYKSTIFMLFSTLSLSFSGVISKYLTGQFSLSVLLFLRLFVPAILMLSLMASTRFMFPQKNLMKVFWVRAFCVMGCQMCFLISLSHLTLVESVVLFATGPLFIPVLERIIFGVKIKATTSIALVVTFIGVILLAGDASGITFKPELLIGLAAGVFNAGSQLSLYRSTKGDMSALALNGWSFLFSSLLVLPISLWFGMSDVDLNIVLEPMTNWPIWLAVIALASVVISNQVFRSKAYKLVDSNSQLAPLIFTNLLFTLVWQVVFFDEALTLEKCIGIGLIISANLFQVFLPKFKNLATKPILSNAHS